MDSLHIDVNVATQIFSSIHGDHGPGPIGILRDAITDGMRYEICRNDAPHAELAAGDIPVYLDDDPDGSGHPYLLRIVTDTRGVMQLKGMRYADGTYLPLEITTESSD